MAAALPSTVVIITAVLLVISAVLMVRSTLSCSTPVNSTNAPLVPDPSSLEITEIAPVASFAFPPHPVQAAAIMLPAKITANMLLVFIEISPFYFS